MVCLLTETGHMARPGKAKRSHNGGARPNAYQRRANRRWLLSPESGFGGDGQTVPCAHCGEPVSFTTMEVDRAKAGAKGGGYQQYNILPSCKPCNRKRGDKSLWSFNPNLARRMARRRKKAIA